MFDTLLESRSPATRRTGGTLVSILVHSALIAGAAYGTSRATALPDRPQAEPVTYVDVRPAPTPPAEVPVPPKGVDVVAAPPLPEGFQVPVAPTVIPDALPPIDLTAPVTDPADFSGRGVPGGIAGGDRSGSPVPARDSSTTYLDVQVERQARAVEGSAPPRYPETLRAGGIEGRVLAQFVVGTDGRADLATFRILETPHVRFGDAVREAVRGMRFEPAEVAGRPVRQLVLMPFTFALR